MKIRPDRKSPWGKRIWLEEHEFEELMDEVRMKSGQSRIKPGTGVDVDAIFERVYGVVPDFDTLPNGVLGKTVFQADGQFNVYLSRELAEEAELSVVARRRLRATAAHECAHVVLHRYLHMDDVATIGLFGDEAKRVSRVLCRREAIGRPAYLGEWWEFQANRGMASLLVPKSELERAIKRSLKLLKLKSVDKVIEQGEVENLVRELMGYFDVSMQLMTFRMQGLGFLPKDINQKEFALEE